MSGMIVEEADLPTSLDAFQATAAAYPEQLALCRESLLSGLPVLVQCDKQLVPFFYRGLRDHLKAAGNTLVYLDGRPRPEDPPGVGLVGRILAHLADAVRGAVDQRILVLPHLDLMTGVTGMGGLTGEAREMVALLYENPTIVWLGFRDLTLPLPPIIDNLFPRKVQILGVPRERLGHLVTQAESRKFGTRLDTFKLYRYVSGVNAVQLRRILSALDGEDYPSDPTHAYDQLRQSTLSSDVELPDLDLHSDIGGYEPIKKRLQTDIIDLVRAHGASETAADAQRIEGLIPRGIIFYGPPGTGKTLFAKAMARSLGAATIVVSGPELKSKWVGESEANLRRVFVLARQSAPAVIIFDELDSFASARGTYDGGAGVEHAMVNTLLTEMDGFRRNEMVFVVGTTNFSESLDPALLRPGRFEFRLGVPYPNEEDRREILKIYDGKMGLQLEEEALEALVKRTGHPMEGTSQPYAGDHLNAVCRAMARQRLRKAAETGEPAGASSTAEVEEALTAHLNRPKLTPREEKWIATHECGHAICAMYCDNVPPIERISIRGDIGGALGAVFLSEHTDRYVQTRAQMRDHLVVMFGGRAAEEMMYSEVSSGAAGDLAHATHMARRMCDSVGMGSIQAAQYDPRVLSEPLREEVDRASLALLHEAEERARTLVREHRAELEALCAALLKHKVLDATTLASFKEASDG